MHHRGLSGHCCCRVMFVLPPHSAEHPPERAVVVPTGEQYGGEIYAKPYTTVGTDSTNEIHHQA